MTIPQYLLAWFAKRNWSMHPYQQTMFKLYAKKQSTLLIVPTGGGKTLASFLPSLIDIHEHRFKGLHTLYISPLKALTADIERNLQTPIFEMGLSVTTAVRTGDTSSYRRTQQRKKPPNILLTTPESLLLLLSYENAADYFASLKVIIIDELHQFVTSKRGDLTSLAIARLDSIAPKLMHIGLSATVAKPTMVAAWLDSRKSSEIMIVKDKIKPSIKLISSNSQIPYSGFMAVYAVNEILNIVARNTLTLIFVNTRAQTELLFRELWKANTENLAIAIYHGSLSKEQRGLTEKLILENKLRAIVTTSALELGIDWGEVDCVIQVGAPKGISRLLQRIGRSNHQFDKASQAILVPANCFDTLECFAAIHAIEKEQLDDEEISPGSHAVIIQFIINCACSMPINKKNLYRIITAAYPYRHLTYQSFSALFSFANNGGYTLKHYPQYHRLRRSSAGYRISSPQTARRHRQNIGTIVESPHLRVKLVYKRKRKIIGEIEEAFALQLAPGDSFLFAGEILEFMGIRDMFLEARKTNSKNPLVPSYEGGTMPLSTHLAEEVQALISEPERWVALPKKIQHWLYLQQQFSALPAKNATLVESFPYKKQFHLVMYAFSGRQANYSLAMLISKRMEKLKLGPLSLTVTDYAIAISSVHQTKPEMMTELFHSAKLQDEFNYWVDHSSILKRTFRKIAVIAGLIERQLAGTRKTLRQVTFSTDLIYDVLRRHEPNHVLLSITQHEVNHALLAYDKVLNLLARFQGTLIINLLSRPSPMSAPVLTTFKTERITGSGLNELLSQKSLEAEANQLINEVSHLVE